LGKKNFKLQLAKTKKVTYVGLEMPCFADPMDVSTYSTPLAIYLACGKEMDYGTLFSYLFRRFGYPNQGWDDYKQLAKYILTTPLSDMVLMIVPYCGNDTSLHFSFMVPMETTRKIRDYERRDYLVWLERMFDWIEANKMLPDWMESGMEYLNREHKTSLTWRQAFDSIGILYSTEEGKEPVSVGYDWQQEVHKAYSEIEAPPSSCPQRSYDWREWPDDDPCKAYNQAAYEALLDLKRPVEVRDIFINAFGRVKSPGRQKVLSGASSAGFPSGALGNEDPKGFAEIHAIINKIGAGNTKRGIKKALSIIKTSVKCC
jgi:hypothetical protein